MNARREAPRRLKGGAFASLLVAAAFAGLAAASCAPLPDDAGASPPDPRITTPGDGHPGEGVGSFSMSLTLGGRFRFGDVGYDVSGGSGFHKAGTIDAAGSATISTIIGGIPFGTGYVVRLTAQDIDHALMPCTGSSAFDVASPATVPVPVHLTCREIRAVPVPVPPWATAAFAALLLVLGARALGRQRLMR